MSHLPTVRQLVESWILVSPVRSLMKVGEVDGAATAKGNFLGENKSDPAAEGKAIYTEKKNLPTAVASILNHVQNRADFHPAATPPEDLIKHFNAYVTEIDKTPFFHLVKHEFQKQKFYSKDYHLLIDQIVSLYEGVSEEDTKKLRKSLEDMGKSVFGEERSERWQNLFSQSTLDLSKPEEPRIYVFYTSLHMKHDKSGKAEVTEQDYEVATTTYRVLPELIKAHADSLTKLDKRSVDDWMIDSTTPERVGAKLCFQTGSARKVS